MILIYSSTALSLNLKLHVKRSMLDKKQNVLVWGCFNGKFPFSDKIKSKNRQCLWFLFWPKERN